MSEKWKVFATDTYDYDQWQIGEYDTEDQARTIAINKASEMLRTDVEGPNGKRIGSYQGKQTTPPPLIEQLRATVVEQSQEIGRLREAMQTADETLIEVNLSNYGMDDVDRLNNSSIEASQIIRAALQPKEET